MTPGEHLTVIDALVRAVRMLELCDRMELAPAAFHALGPVGSHLMQSNPLMEGPIWERETSRDEHPMLPVLRQALLVLEQSLAQQAVVSKRKGPA
jgi:hypothetical protein